MPIGSRRGWEMPEAAQTRHGARLTGVPPPRFRLDRIRAGQPLR
jgi:hypothetical protein